MAATKKSTEVITIQPVEKITAEITIVGESPLIVHAWSEKAKREILDSQQGKSKGKKKAVRNPVEDFIRSMYWLSGMSGTMNRRRITGDFTSRDTSSIQLRWL